MTFPAEPARMRQCLEEIEDAQAKDPTPSRSAFEPAKLVPKTAALTARQNGLLAALKAKRLEIAKTQKSRPSRSSLTAP
jgi:hypothetical protein